MIRLLFVEQESQIGGVEKSTVDLVRALDKTNYEPIVTIPKWGPLAEQCQTVPVSVIVVPRPTFRSASFRLAGYTLADPAAILLNPWRLWQAARRLQQQLQRQQADLVVTKGLLAHFYGGWAARRLAIPCIWHVQDEVPAQRAGGLYLRGLQMAAVKLAAAVIGDAATIAHQFPQHPQVFTVYNGIDITEYGPTTAPGTLRRDLGLPEGAVAIGNMARLTDWKGQHLLIEAFQQIAPAFPTAHLVLIGTPLFDNNYYEQRLRHLVAQGPAADRIHFAGYRSDTAPALAALDIYVHPSLRKDTAPLALLSALAVGLPVIISDVPGMVEVVEPEKSALVFAAGNRLALARHLRQLLAQPETAHRLGEAARTLAVTRFSLAAHTEAMTAIFNKVLSS